MANRWAEFGWGRVTHAIGSARRRLRGTAGQPRLWQPFLTGAAALVGLAAVTLGPAAFALAWHDRAERPPAEPVGQPQLGMPAQDGSVTFVVHELRCGSDDELTYGRRCEVTLGARNDGPEPVKVPGAAQWLRVAEGARHQAINLDREPLGELAPGQATTAVLVFDLPRHATVTHVEVHHGTYSRGTPVDVAGQALPLLE